MWASSSWGYLLTFIISDPSRDHFPACTTTWNQWVGPLLHQYIHSCCHLLTGGGDSAQFLFTSLQTLNSLPYLRKSCFKARNYTLSFQAHIFCKLITRYVFLFCRAHLRLRDGSSGFVQTANHSAFPLTLMICMPIDVHLLSEISSVRLQVCGISMSFGCRQPRSASHLLWLTYTLTVQE